jgi:hypothetical protein
MWNWFNRPSTHEDLPVEETITLAPVPSYPGQAPIANLYGYQQQAIAQYQNNWGGQYQVIGAANMIGSGYTCMPNSAPKPPQTTLEDVQILANLLPSQDQKIFLIKLAQIISNKEAKAIIGLLVNELSKEEENCLKILLDTDTQTSILQFLIEIQ